MTIKDAQELVETWNTKNSIQSSELTSMVALTEKIGELASAIARKQSEPHGQHQHSTAGTPPLFNEISDIFWEVLSLAAHSGVDLTEAIASNLETRNSRSGGI